MEKLNNPSVQMSSMIPYHYWWSGGFPGQQEADLKLYPTPRGWRQNLVPIRGYPCRHWHQMHWVCQVVTKYTARWKYLESLAVLKELD